jgi:hypothetical protein
VWLPRPDRFKTPGTNVNIATKGDVFVLTEEQRREMQDINRAQVLRWKEHPEEWGKYLEENHRARPRAHNANELRENAEEFRCIKCFKVKPRTQLASDGERCQQCAEDRPSDAGAT